MSTPQSPAETAHKCWSVQTDAKGEKYIFDSHGDRIAEVYFAQDADVLAAAPELLAALKKYADFVRESGRSEMFDREAFFNNMLHATDLARAAITKAEGLQP